MTPCPACSTLSRDHAACPTCRPSRSHAGAIALLGLLVTACGPGESVDSGVTALYGVAIVDDDNDGYPADSDCNDNDDTVHPCAADADGDGDDTNCDGVDGVDPGVDQECS